MKSSTFIDNLIITDDEKEADKFTEKWKAVVAHEKAESEKKAEEDKKAPDDATSIIGKPDADVDSDDDTMDDDSDKPDVSKKDDDKDDDADL